MIYTFRNGYSVSTDDCVLVGKDRYCPANCKTVEESLYRSPRGLHFIVKQCSFTSSRGTDYESKPVMFPISREKASAWLIGYEKHKKEMEEILQRAMNFRNSREKTCA